MNVELVLDGHPLPLTLERDGENWTANGRAASVLEVEPGIYSVLLDGRSFEARIEKAGESWAVTIGRRRYVLEVNDPRRLRRRRGALAGQGRLEISSPMPGKVVRVLVSQGDRVEANQGLLVVEAMKMQNELKSPQPGTVAQLAVQPGANVAAGEILVIIE